MHKKDPITGIQVLTTLGFFAREAKHDEEGRSAGELMDDMFDQINAAIKETEDTLRTPVAAFDFIKRIRDEVQEYVDEELPVPVEVLYVEEASFSASMLSQRTEISGRCRCDDNTIRTFDATEFSHNPTLNDPGDYESDISFGEPL